MQRIGVTDDGVTLILETEPLVSVFGKQMRPGSTSNDMLSWEEISSISLSATDLAPDGLRWVSLTVDTTWGEFYEVHEDAEGFANAVRELCRLSGSAVPDLKTLAEAGQVIWRTPRPS